MLPLDVVPHFLSSSQCPSTGGAILSEHLTMLPFRAVPYFLSSSQCPFRRGASFSEHLTMPLYGVVGALVFGSSREGTQHYVGKSPEA